MPSVLQLPKLNCLRKSPTAGDFQWGDIGYSLKLLGHFLLGPLHATTLRPLRALAQLAAIGHPIAGDLKYGSRTMPGKSVSPDRRDATRTQAAKTNTGHIGAPAGIGVSLDRKQVQFLCAYRLVFPQDTTLEQLAGKEFRI